MRSIPADTSRQLLAFRLLAVTIAILSAAHFLVFTARHLGSTEFDDAFMFTRYAKHWLAGAGISWNIADGPSYGITSLSYLAVTTALRGLTSLSDPLLLTGASFVFGALAVAAIVVLGFVTLEDGPLRRSWAPLLAVPGIVFFHPFRYHCLTGMETTAALFVNALFAISVIVWVRRRSTSLFLACLAAAYLSYLTRPDQGLFALLLPPLFLLADDRDARRPAAAYTASFLAILAVDASLKWLLLGSPVPYPALAKYAGAFGGYMGAQRWNAMKQMLYLATAASPFLLLAAATVDRRSAARLAAIALPMILTFAYYATLMQIMGREARYYYASLPFIALGAFVAASPPHSPERDAARPWRALAVLSVVLVTLSGPFKAVLEKLWITHAVPVQVHRTSRTVWSVAARDSVPHLGWQHAMLAMSRALRRMPDAVTLATTEHGYLGSENPRKTIIDLAGLHDRDIARSGFTEHAVFGRRPDIIWMPPDDYTDWLAIVEESPRLARDYAYFPDIFDYGVAVRKDSPHRAPIMRALKAEFRRVYPGKTLREADRVGMGHADMSMPGRVAMRSRIQVLSRSLIH